MSQDVSVDRLELCVGVGVYVDVKYIVVIGDVKFMQFLEVENHQTDVVEGV